MGSRLAVAGAVVALVVAAGAGAAETRDELIRPGVGIGKIRLGMTQPQVRGAMGKPLASFSEPYTFGRRLLRMQYGFGAYTVSLVGRPGSERVVAVSTVLRKEGTPEGVRRGWLERDVARVYRRALRCAVLEIKMHQSTRYSADKRNCYLAGRDGTHTVFRMLGETLYGDNIQKWPSIARVHEIVVKSTTFRDPSIGE